jgi:hypothetical protein
MLAAMAKKETDPVDRLGEMFAQSAKKEPFPEKQELAQLLQSLPVKLPPAGTSEHEAYLAIERKIAALKERIVKTHGEWMEMVDSEEKISRDLDRNGS